VIIRLTLPVVHSRAVWAEGRQLRECAGTSLEE